MVELGPAYFEGTGFFEWTLEGQSLKEWVLELRGLKKRIFKFGF